MPVYLPGMRRGWGESDMENVPQRTQRTRRKFERDVMDSLFTLFCIPLRSSASSAVRFSPVVRSGISLLEVLIAIFVLSIGLLGIAALIPLGKLAMMETEKSDRTGACGRAALRDVKVRRMLDPGSWFGGNPNMPIFVIDPLYYAANPTIFGDTTPLPQAPCLGGLPYTLDPAVVRRINFDSLMFRSTDTPAQIQARRLLSEQIFYWQDELLFDLPGDRNPPPANAGDRPMSVVDTITGEQLRNANYSWFLTVAPKQSDKFLVSIVVCKGRILTQTGTPPENAQPDGEEYTNPTTFEVTSPSGPIGYGGLSIRIEDQVNTPPVSWPTKWNLKKNDWILLYSTNSANSYQIGWASWYRVVHAGFDGTYTHITLVGPDWHGGNGTMDWYGNDSPNPLQDPMHAISVQGVTGVYTTTVQLDSDLIWSQ